MLIDSLKCLRWFQHPAGFVCRNVFVVGWDLLWIMIKQSNKCNITSVALQSGKYFRSRPSFITRGHQMDFWKNYQGSNLHCFPFSGQCIWPALTHEKVIWRSAVIATQIRPCCQSATEHRFVASVLLSHIQQSGIYIMGSTQSQKYIESAIILAGHPVYF